MIPEILHNIIEYLRLKSNNIFYFGNYIYCDTKLIKK